MSNKRITGESDDEYHSYKGRITSSMVKLAITDKYKFCGKYVTEELKDDPRADHFKMGHAWEDALAVPFKDWTDTVGVLPKIDKRTKAGKAKLKELEEKHKDKKFILSEDEADLLRKMMSATYENDVVKKIIMEDREYQVVFRDDYKNDRVLQCKTDLLIDSIENDYPELGISKGMRVVIDIKTTRNPLDNFLYDCIDWGYNVQEAFYRQVMSKCGYPVDKFVFMATTKVWPYNTVLFTLPDEVIAMTRKQIVDIMPNMLRWMDGNLPDFPKVRNLQFSEYSLKKMGLIK